jgi:hypothetical protein
VNVIVIPSEPAETVLRRNVDPDDGWRYVRRPDGLYDFGRPGLADAGVLSWSEVLGRCGTDGVVPAVPLQVDLPEGYSQDVKRAFARIEELEHDRSRAMRRAEAAGALLHAIQQAARQYHVALTALEREDED